MRQIFSDVLPFCYHGRGGGTVACC
jgi:hypothetical protein